MSEAPLSTLVPAPLRLLRLNWKVAVRRDASDIPYLSPDFVAEQGNLVRILDVRHREELSGPLGHIPAVTHVPFERLGEVPGVLDRETCVVVVSNRGSRAGIAARYLEELGMLRVAALDGGMTAYKAQGYTTSRDEGSIRTKLVALAPGLGRDGRPIEQASGAPTAAQIAAHIGEPGSVRYIKLAAFLLNGKHSCVDGRDDHAVIGTPGGDAGELLLALSAVETLTGRQLGDEEVARILIAHTDTFGRFYMHSDTHAMNSMIVDGLRKDPRLADRLGDVFEPEEWRAFLRRPPVDLGGVLLEHLEQAKNMGCGHLRFVMTDERYEVRPALARGFLRAFHVLRWGGSPEIEWVILGGDHKESAVASVLMSGPLHSYTRIPLISPQVAGKQVFVNHPQVTSRLRSEMAAFLAETGVVPGRDEARLLELIEERGGRQMGASLGRLAGGLPIFEIHFGAGGPSVAEVGRVG